MRSRLLPAVCAAVAVLLTGCATGHVTAQRAADPGSVQAPPAGVVPPATTEPSPDQLPSASPSASPSPRKPALPTYDVKAVQTQLASMHYYAGAIDGQPGPSFQSAVMAFQKVQGIGADAVVGKGTLAALKAPTSPALKAAAPSDRVEVDLTKQVLYVVKSGVIARILPVSSGNGATYLQKNGHTAKALSPIGWYKIERRILGAHKADLGTLYDPQFFYRGWAIHGSNSVPPWPASHGCIRVTRTDAKYLLDALHIGMSVYVYGGRYTFTAGSSAPGTDNPTGDTSSGGSASPAPSPSPSSTPAPSSSPSASPSASPSPVTPSPAPSPTA